MLQLSSLYKQFCTYLTALPFLEALMFCYPSLFLPFLFPYQFKSKQNATSLCIVGDIVKFHRVHVEVI